MISNQFIIFKEEENIMLKINGQSKNFDGTSEINGVTMCSMSGSLSGDSLYVNVNANNIETLEANKNDVLEDITNFIDTILIA